MRRLAPLALTLALLSACHRPQALRTETRRRIAVDPAPLLPEAEEDERPLALLHPGDVVEVVGPAKDLHWKGPLLDGDGERSGALLEVRRAVGEPIGYLFASDLGAEVKVPEAGSLCQRMGGPPACAGRLRRILLDDGGVLAFDPCGIGPCRAAVERSGAVETITVEGLGALRVATVAGQRVALAETRWVRAPRWTGATTIVLRVGRRLERALEVLTEEVDGRSAPSSQRMGTLRVEGDALHFRGTRRMIAPTNGAVLHTDPIDETYRLAAKAALK